jgi:hypothetical protein
MAQDLVTAKDVAAPAEVTLQFQDAQLICDKLDDALAKEKYGRTAYSEPIRSLFQAAWTVAAHKRNTQVTVYHLACALLWDPSQAGKELVSYLESDVESFAVGCILKVLPLGVPTGDKDIVPPSVDAVRWVGEAVALTLKRGENSELLPTDLVQAVQGGTVPRSVRAQLRAAARLGAARREAILGPRSVPTISAAPASPSEIIKHIEEVEKGQAAAGPTDGLTNLVELLDDVVIRLENIDRRLTELPRTPSGARLAIAIVAVLVLGVVAGLALQFPQPWGALLAQVFSTDVK